ncbi:MAG: group II intron reverse transcriptase/maturase [Caldilineaceae bacterium]
MKWFRRPAQDEPPAVFSGAARSFANPPMPTRAAGRRGALFQQDDLRRAWLAIKQAGGGAGVDGVTLANFEENLEENLRQLAQELSSANYRPRPVRQVLVPKQNGGLRPLALWALRDRVAQRAVYECLLPIFEPLFLPCSFGFRPERNVEQAVEQLISHRNANLRWVVDADIQHCFDEIDSDRLLKQMRPHVRERLLLRYVEAWLRADILNSADGAKQQAGASQGNVLSPLLANIYLHDFDLQLQHRQLSLVRYADDFVICCRRKEEAQKAEAQAAQALAALNLKLHPQKTRIVHFDQGFRWLGYVFIRNECYRM